MLTHLLSWATDPQKREKQEITHLAIEDLKFCENKKGRTEYAWVSSNWVSRLILANQIKCLKTTHLFSHFLFKFDYTMNKKSII